MRFTRFCPCGEIDTSLVESPPMDPHASMPDGATAEVKEVAASVCGGVKAGSQRVDAVITQLSSYSPFDGRTKVAPQAGEWEKASDSFRRRFHVRMVEYEQAEQPESKEGEQPQTSPRGVDARLVEYEQAEHAPSEPPREGSCRTMTK